MFRCLSSLLAVGVIGARLAAAQTVVPPPAGTADTNATQPIVIYPAGQEPQPEPSPVLWQGHVATLGAVTLDASTKTVTATGWVNQTAGLIEVLACGIQGKVHESVFVIPLNPLDLQAALLLTGLKSGPPMPAVGEGPPHGDPVNIFVDWQEGDETRTARAEAFIWNNETDSVLPDTPWTFTGSMVKDGHFKAFAEESYVVSYWDPYAIINLPLPCGADDEILAVNTNIVPAYRTPITMRFVPAAP